MKDSIHGFLFKIETQKPERACKRPVSTLSQLPAQQLARDVLGWVYGHPFQGVIKYSQASTGQPIQRYAQPQPHCAYES